MRFNRLEIFAILEGFGRFGRLRRFRRFGRYRRIEGLKIFLRFWIRQIEKSGRYQIFLKF